MTRTPATALAFAFLALAAGGIAWLVASRGEADPGDTRATLQSDRSEAPTVSRPTGESGSERASVVESLTLAGISREPDALPSPAPSGNALVRVKVILADRTPVVGAACRLTPLDASGGGTTRMASTSHAGVGEWTNTEVNGRCELEAAPDREHWLGVSLPDGEIPLRRIPALAAGEVFDVDVDASARLDLDFHGIVVDAETGEPLPGAEIEGLQERSDVRLATDAYGRFALRLDSGTESRARVSARGYARRDFRLGSDHETEVSALVVHLSPAATLRVTVLDGAGVAVPRAGVSASVPWYLVAENEGASFSLSGERPIWTTITDASGSGILSDLPPNVPLDVVAFHEELSRKHPDPLELAPREIRDLELRLGGGALLRGLLVDLAGTPIAGYDIWCLPAGRPYDAPIRHFQSGEVRARATTDEHGKFELSDLAAATWWLAPAPRDERSALVDGEDLLPLAQPVVVEPFAQLVDVVLRAERGGYLQGTVLDPRGSPAVGASVRVDSHGGPRFFGGGRTEKDGAFVVGPLRAGHYEITASDHQRYADSTPIEADAGATGLVLRLREGGGIAGSVVDGATGERRDAEIAYVQTDVENAGSWNTMTPDGSFDFRGLVPGVYVIGARTRAETFGYATELAVSAGQVLGDVRVVLSPGGTLRMKYDGPSENVYCAISAHGLRVTRASLDRGATVDCSVPAETLELVIWEPGTAAQEKRSVTVTAGEIVELVLGKE